MKYHPDRVRCEGPDGGEAAKKSATARFAEISAAYELLSSGTSSGASHPSFASTTATASAPPSAATYQGSLFQRSDGIDHFSGFDPFGFGAYNNFFSDPFELFRQTFPDAFADETTMDATRPPPFANVPFSSAMYAPSFTGFGAFRPLFDSNNNFPAASSSSVCFSSSTYSVGGAGALPGTTSRTVSTTTTVVNGKTATRREETVVNPDGTTTTTVSTSGDEQGERRSSKRKAIAASRAIRGRIENGRATTHPARPPAPSQGKSDSRHHRGYKVESKQRLEQNQAGHTQPTHHPVMPPGPETYIVDLTSDVVDLTGEDAATASKERAEITGENSNPTAVEPSQQSVLNTLGSDDRPPATRKRKFCEIMSRCFMCCFPVPRKKRRVNAVT